MNESTSSVSQVLPDKAIIVADPTLFIAICWVVSALLLGGLVVHALYSARGQK